MASDLQRTGAEVLAVVPMLANTGAEQLITRDRLWCRSAGEERRICARGLGPSDSVRYVLAAERCVVRPTLAERWSNHHSSATIHPEARS